MSTGQRVALGVAAGVVVCGLVYAGFFAWPRRVVFSYAGTTCLDQVALWPDFHRAVEADKYRLEYRGTVAIGQLKFASTRLCFVPAAAPVKGVARVASAPFGGWAFRVHYDVMVGEPPQVLAMTRPAQAVGKPVEVGLSQADTVFEYRLELDDKQQSCARKSAQLACGVDKLGLKQGASYTLKLRRLFGGKPVGEAMDVPIAILPATRVLSASVKPDEVIYAKPKSADITLDKALVSAVAKLELAEGDKLTPVTTRTGIDGARVLLAWDDDLPREKTFRLTLLAAAAGDGSALDAPYSLNFRTSGGPKVLGVNIGDGGVAADARVVVTFDQALSRANNLAGLASISGGGAGITWQGANQVVFALRDIPRCGAFTLNIARGIANESGITSNHGWSFTSRVSCRTTRTIGHSVRGRPIQAYFYGSGPTTILFTGGIHGNEPSGTYLLQDWVAYLDTNSYKIPAGKQVVVVPNLNPDGIATNTRYNVNNVNIDRNFPASDWVSNIILTNGQTLAGGGGSVPLSEPETRAIADLTSSLQVRAEISFHASGSLVGANKVADSVAIGTRYASGVGYGTMFYNPEEIMGYTLTGEYETWMGEKLGIPAILIELPTASGRYFSRHLSTLWAMVEL